MFDQCALRGSNSALLEFSTQGSKTMPRYQGSARVVRLKGSPALRVPGKRALRREHLLNDVSLHDGSMNDLGDVELSLIGKRN